MLLYSSLTPPWAKSILRLPTLSLQSKAIHLTKKGSWGRATLSALQERLEEDLKAAMRSGDTLRRSTIRYLRSQVQNEEIARREALEDEDLVDLLGRQAAQRRESIDAFKKGDRQDLVEKEEAELAIVLEYLPAQMSDEEITVLVRSVIQDVGAEGPRDMGKVMGRVIPEVKGKADNRKVSQLVSELLAGPG